MVWTVHQTGVSLLPMLRHLSEEGVDDGMLPWFNGRQLGYSEALPVHGPVTSLMPHSVRHVVDAKRGLMVMPVPEYSV